jgi:Arc/MetJ-type ribon-helix-helix transcriptional regulator
MKLSVSLPDEDVDFLDAHARAHGLSTRSSVLRRAVRLLRDSELGNDYADAWEEWASSGEAEAWEVTAGDGLVER